MAQVLRILIVDDSLPMRFVLRGYLEEAGHEVVAEASDEEEALKAYSRLKPDIVTLDLSLIKGDGVGTLKALRQIDPQVKVLVVSGNCQQKIQEIVQSAGAVGFLGKPFEPGELQEALSRAVKP